MNQRRSPSPAVFRRRRLVAAVIVVLLLGALIWGASAMINAFLSSDSQTQQSAGDADSAVSDEGDAGPNTDANPAEPSEPAEPTEDADSSENPDANDDGDTCNPAHIEVRAATNEENYSATTAPLLILEIENTGNSFCTLDVGAAQQEFTLTHQGQIIFTTSQCDIDDESLEVEFEPGDTERAQLLWPRANSATSCSQPADVPPGEYELTVGLGNLRSEPVTFTIEESV